LDFLLRYKFLQKMSCLTSTLGLFLSKQFPYFEQDVWADQCISTLDKVRGNRTDLDHAKPDESNYSEQVLRKIYVRAWGSTLNHKLYCQNFLDQME